MSTYALAMELAKTSELLQSTYSLLRQRDRELDLLQNSFQRNQMQTEVTVDNTLSLLKMLYPSQEEAEYQP
jgi:hypothetical protein